MTRMDIVANILLIQNVTGHPDLLSTMWSLPFEIQMYAALPLLYSIRKVVPIQMIWSATLLVVGIVLALAPPVGAILRYVPCFCAGLVAYGMLRNRDRKGLRFSLMPPLLFLILITFVVAASFHRFEYALDAFASLSVGVLTGSIRGTIPGLVSRIAAVVAKYSYGIYLAHLPLMILLLTKPIGTTKILAFSILATLTPVLVYHAIEHPMIVAGGRLAGRLAGQRRAS